MLIFLFIWRLLVWKSVGKSIIEIYNYNAILLINIINSFVNIESKIDKKINVFLSFKLWLCVVIKCKFNIGKVNICNFFCYYINFFYLFLIEIFIVEILFKNSRCYKMFVYLFYFKW